VGGPDTRITNPRWQTAAILEKSKNCYISAVVTAILTKFDTVTQFVPLERSDCQSFKISKIQDGGGRHLEKSKNSHMSAAVLVFVGPFPSTAVNRSVLSQYAGHNYAVFEWLFQRFQILHKLGKFCMKFGYLILRKISKFVAIRCQIMKAKNAPNAISAGAPLHTPLGELTALPRLLLALRGLLLRNQITTFHAEFPQFMQNLETLK